MHCYNCGNEIQDNWKYCDKCGKSNINAQNKNILNIIDIKKLSFKQYILCVMAFIVAIIISHFIYVEYSSSNCLKLAQNYIKNGDYDSAISSYKEAAKIKPNKLDVLNLEIAKIYNKKGISYYKAGKYDIAIENYRRAIDINPSNPIFYINLGHAYYKKERYIKAIESYVGAINANPNDVKTYGYLGITIKEQDFIPNMKVYEKAISKDQNTNKLVFDAIKQGVFYLKPDGLTHIDEDIYQNLLKTKLDMFVLHSISFLSRIKKESNFTAIDN